MLCAFSSLQYHSGIVPTFNLRQAIEKEFHFPPLFPHCPVGALKSWPAVTLSGRKGDRLSLSLSHSLSLSLSLSLFAWDLMGPTEEEAVVDARSSHSLTLFAIALPRTLNLFGG